MTAVAAARMEGPLLELRDLRVALGSGPHPTHALRGVDLELPAGEATGLVGESGSGKSTTMLAVIGLLPASGRVLGGSIRFAGRELLELREREWRELRGAEIGSIFQNARAALHPLLSIGDQLVRAYRRHHRGSQSAARRQAVEMLAAVGLPRPGELAHRYPHQLSGGQCQRAMIGMALISHPRLILADEPTSGLDVTVQQQVLETLVARVRDFNAALLLISHDVRVIEETCDRVAVMYAGEVVEAGSRTGVLDRPAHPYTQALLAAAHPSGDRMVAVPGAVPDLRLPIHGCPFATRCPERQDACTAERPAPRAVDSGQSVRCILYPTGAAAEVPEATAWR